MNSPSCCALLMSAKSFVAAPFASRRYAGAMAEMELAHAIGTWTRAALARHYPGREIVTLNVDPLGEMGGGIHCATQQMPAV